MSGKFIDSAGSGSAWLLASLMAIWLAVLIATQFSSVAQFEREVMSRPLRERLVAPGAMQVWTAGRVPLGYDLRGRTLVVNQAEAGMVREIFGRYLALRCVRKLRAELAAKGVTSKWQTPPADSAASGVPYSRRKLYLILQNYLYLDGAATGEAAAAQGGIVSRALWDAVQARLQANREARRLRLAASA
jgi:hypothetical protein